MRYLLLVLLLVICSCTTTTTSIISVKDETVGHPAHTSIIISAPYDDLETRSYIENLFEKTMLNENVAVYRGMDILPPLKEYTADEIENRFRSKSIQLLLVVGINDFWNNYYTTPDISITTSETKSTGDLGGWSEYGKLFAVSTKSTSKTTHYKGITLSQSNVGLDTRLFQLEENGNLKMIWRANSTTSGNYFTPGSTVLKGAAEKIAAQLNSDGILKNNIGFDSRPSALIGETLLLGGPKYNVILGCLTCGEDDSLSIKNKSGIYGIGSQNSIWNRSSIYASDTSECSICSIDARYPPIVVNQYGAVYGKLSINPRISMSNRKFYYSERLRYWIEWIKKEICINSRN